MNTSPTAGTATSGNVPPSLTVPPPAAVLEVHGLCFGFAQREMLNNAPQFTNFSVEVPTGVTWVGGDESSGKTTLLRLMAGELLPRSGSLQINGIRVADQADAYRQQVFWADPQSTAFDALTPLAYWESVQRRYPAFDKQLLAELIDGLSLAPHQDKALYMLSTGTKRKVWLAAAFASGATVTLLDEPFAALDKASIGLVLELLQDAASHPTRAWVIAGYEAPRGVALAAHIDLGE